MNKTVTAEHPLQSTYDKGSYLEDLFAEFMKSDLGWDKTKTRTQMRSHYTNRGSNVDVIAERVDAIRDKIITMATIVSVIGVGSIVCMFLFSDYARYFGVLLSPCVVIFAMSHFILNKFYRPEHAWVECKNRQGNVTYDEMQKTIHQLEAYKASGDKEYKLVEHCFVSATGYVDTALKLAMDKKVTCYLYKDSAFTEVSYWNGKH